MEVITAYFKRNAYGRSWLAKAPGEMCGQMVLNGWEEITEEDYHKLKRSDSLMVDLRKKARFM